MRKEIGFLCGKFFAKLNMMDEEIKNFIKDNQDLIKYNEWEEIYKKDFPEGFTETLLEAGINPLNQGLNYIPDRFLNHSKIEEFIIPDGITSIGTSAFLGCTSLTSIEIPNSVTSIDVSAFCSCNSLTSVEIPNSVTSIGYNAFSDCTSLTSVVIPDGITSINWSAFYKCTSLTSITIPNSVITIGNSAFEKCTSLANVTIGNSVTSIDRSAFSNCTSLTSITYLGTKEEAITKLKVRNKKWREGSPIKKIICTDGEIIL